MQFSLQHCTGFLEGVVLAPRKLILKLLRNSTIAPFLNLGKLGMTEDIEAAKKYFAEIQQTSTIHSD